MSIVNIAFYFVLFFTCTVSILASSSMQMVLNCLTWLYTLINKVTERQQRGMFRLLPNRVLRVLSRYPQSEADCLHMLCVLPHLFSTLIGVASRESSPPLKEAIRNICCLISAAFA